MPHNKIVVKTGQLSECAVWTCVANIDGFPVDVNVLLGGTEGSNYSAFCCCCFCFVYFFCFVFFVFLFHRATST